MTNDELTTGRLSVGFTLGLTGLLAGALAFSHPAPGPAAQDLTFTGTHDLTHTGGGEQAGPLPATLDTADCTLDVQPEEIPTDEEYVRLRAESDRPLAGERQATVPEESGLAVQSLQSESEQSTIVVLDTREAVPGEWELSVTDGEIVCTGSLRVIEAAPEPESRKEKEEVPSPPGPRTS